MLNQIIQPFLQPDKLCHFSLVRQAANFSQNLIAALANYAAITISGRSLRGCELDRRDAYRTHTDGTKSLYKIYH